jgi:mRNA-degrading endonuclease RelE of RelBE toxin-antitoxin system
MQGVIETADFLADAAATGMSEEERALIVLALSEKPKLGDLMPGTGGARKVRFASPGKGKRGGYRVIHYYGGEDIPVFLLAVLKKGERADLSQAEKNELRKELAGLKQDYLAAIRTKAREARRSRR